MVVDEKSNELTAIPRLLELLDVHGALVTIDAMGCQKDIAQKIVDGRGDYILPVKENQPHLLEDIQTCLAKALESDGAGIQWDTHETEDHAHGRQEKRSYRIIVDPEGIRNQEAWANLRVIGMCTSERVVNGKRSDEIHYFIGSRVMSARKYGQALRGHWGIENNLHWQLDLTWASPTAPKG